MLIETFHGSLNPSIAGFHIASHFGSSDQALSAIGAKRFLDEETAGNPTLYKVTIEVPDTNLFKVKKDWGKFGAQGALIAVKELLLKGATPQEQTAIARRFANHHVRINNPSPTEDPIRLAEQFLLQEAKETIQVIEYENKVENSGTSYCVLNPELISIVSTTTPTWLDVIKEFKNHGDWEQKKDVVEALERQLLSEAV